MKVYCLVVVITILFGSCKVMQQGKVNTEVPDEFRAEYYFSLVEAQKQMILGNYSLAKSLYLRCLEIQPNNAPVDFQIANLYMTVGNFDSALSYARRACQMDQRNEYYVLQIAQIYQGKNKLDSTIYWYQLLLKSHSKFEYKITLATLYLKSNNLNSALKLLNSIEAEYGPNKQTITNKYRIFILKNDNRKCIQILKNAIREFPEESQYYGLLGEHFSALGDYESALENFKEVLRIEPENENGYLSIIDLYKKFQKYHLALDSAGSFMKRTEFSRDRKIEMLSGLLTDKMDFDHSEKVFEMIDTLSLKYPDDTNVPVLKAGFFIRLKQYKNAELVLRNLLLMNQKVEIAWEKLLFVLDQNRDYKEVLKVSGEGITLFPKNAWLYFFRGISLYRSGSCMEAIQSLESALKYAGDNKKLSIQTNSLLGECWNYMQEYDKSDAYFESALKMDPKNSVILNKYSYELALRGMYLKRALGYSKRCIMLEPNNGTFLDTYGWILFKSGKIRKSEEFVRKAIQFGGLTNKGILEHYIEILVVLNKKSEASRYSEILKNLETDRFKNN